MQRTKTILLTTALTMVACAVEHDDEPAFRGLELEASSGEPVCSDETQVVPGDVTKLYTVIAADVVELHDGVSSVIDEKTGIMYLDNGLSGVQCRCNGGCSEALPCTTGGDGTTMSCSGQCVGTDNDGQSCAGCTWHVVEVPSPTGTPGGLDPDPDPFDKPPGIDPTSGELDPTRGGGELPPFDPPPGELDPTL